MDNKRKTPKLEEMGSSELKFAMTALRDLMKDSMFSKAKKIFEDIIKAIEKASERERRINTIRCLKLQSEIEANTSKIKAAIQLSEEDKNTIDTLKEELEKAWNVADGLRMERSKDMYADDHFSEVDKRSTYSSTFSFQKKSQDFEDAEKMWRSEKKSLQKEVESQRKTSENLKVEMKQLQQQIKDMNSILSKKNEEIKQIQTNFKVVEEMKVDKELGKGDQAAILDEIEKSRLQIFELEEELTHKEKVIEELTQEKEQKTLELEQLQKEILTRKDINLSERIDEERCSSEVKQYKKIKNVCESKDHKNFKKQIHELLIKENEMLIKMKHLEFSLAEKTNLLYKTQDDNYLLRTTLHKEKELHRAFSEKYIILKTETNKSIKTLKEWENLRNKYVSAIGKLETKNHELERELATLEHFKYREKIISLQDNLMDIKRELEEKESYIKETNEEIFKIKTETDELSKHLQDSLKITEMIHTNRDTFIEAKSKFCEGKLSINMVNINLFILILKDKIKDLVERYKDITMEKYKMYDEIESLKIQRYSVQENESKWTETEPIFFDEGQNSDEGTEIFSYDQVSSLDIKVLETNIDFTEADEKIEKLNEEAKFQGDETNLKFIKPEMTHVCLEINSLNYSSDYKSSRVDSNCLSVIQDEERKSFSKTVKLSRSTEENLEKNLKTQEDGDTRSLQKTIKRRTSIPDVVTANDLIKFRSQLRMKQKKLDTMQRELESSSSSFSTNSGIYKKDSQKRIMNAISVKKLPLGRTMKK